jgi:hypothetical protein
LPGDYGPQMYSFKCAEGIPQAASGGAPAEVIVRRPHAAGVPMTCRFTRSSVTTTIHDIIEGFGVTSPIRVFPWDPLHHSVRAIWGRVAHAGNALWCRHEACRRFGAQGQGLPPAPVRLSRLLRRCLQRWIWASGPTDHPPGHLDRPSPRLPSWIWQAGDPRARRRLERGPERLFPAISHSIERESAEF